MRTRKRLSHFFRDVREDEYRPDLRAFDEDELRGQEQQMIRSRISGYTAMATGIVAAPLTVGATFISAGVGYRRTDVNTTRIELIRERQQQEGWKGHKVDYKDVMIPVAAGLIGTALGFGVDGVVDALVSPGGTGASSALAGGTGTESVVNGGAPVAHAATDAAGPSVNALPAQVSVEPLPTSFFTPQPVMPMGDSMGMGIGIDPSMGGSVDPSMGIGMDPSMGSGMDPSMGVGIDPGAGMGFEQIPPPVMPFMDPSAAGAIPPLDNTVYGAEPQQWIPSYENGAQPAYESAYPQGTEALTGAEPSMPGNAGIDSTGHIPDSTDPVASTSEPPGLSQWVPNTPGEITAGVVGLAAAAASHFNPLWGEAVRKAVNEGAEKGGQTGARKLLEKFLDNKDSKSQNTSRHLETPPATATGLSPEASAHASLGKPTATIIKGQAILDFRRRQPGDLWFRIGDDIDILQPDSDDGSWWTGWTDDRVGKFPPHYVTIKDRCRALYSFDAAGDDELSFNENDTIEIIKRAELRDDWWIGRRGVKMGVFPGNYVADIPQGP